ncbi:MAG TPA: sugar phosphate isomerase/epimerase family protein [Flavobacterium sp.]|nr:sugar phosphate isomerase/epimerase family protein [Flavobacterium sp.]
MKNKIFPGIALSPRLTKFGPVMFSGHLEDGLKAVSAAGFKYVELSLRSTNDVDPDELNATLEKLNLKITAIATGQACLFDQLCLGADDEQLRKKAVDHFKAITLLAKKINSGAVIIGGIRGRLSGSESEYERNFDNGVNAIRECANWTKANGIPLLIEPINRYETNWIFTAEDGCDLIDRLGVSSVKLLLDTFHMNIEEPSIINAIIKTGDRLGYVHFADNTRHAPGQGQTDFKNILSALERIGYSGPVVAEVLPLPDDKTAVTDTAKFWKNMDIAL